MHVDLQGSITLVNRLYVIELPKSQFGDLRIRSVRGVIGGHKYSGWLTEQSGKVYIVVPPEWIQKTGVSINEPVDVNLEIREIGLPLQATPEEVEVALSTMGVSIDVLTQFERQQLFSSVVESSTPEVRAKRVQAIINACVIKHERQKQLHSQQQ